MRGDAVTRINPDLAGLRDFRPRMGMLREIMEFCATGNTLSGQTTSGPSSNPPAAAPGLQPGLAGLACKGAAGLASVIKRPFARV